MNVYRGSTSRRRAISLAAALLVQALAISFLGHDLRQPPAPHAGVVASTSSPVTVTPRLVESPPALTSRHQPMHARLRPYVPSAEQLALPVPDVDVEEQALRPSPSDTAPTSPLSTVITGAPVTTPSVRPGTPVLSTPRSTLNLALPARRPASSPDAYAMQDQVRADPRSHSERRGVEWSVADAAGTLPVEVNASTSGSGSTIIRQGSKCIRVTENRVAALNPMDERLKGAPSLVGNCFGK